MKIQTVTHSSEETIQYGMHLVRAVLSDLSKKAIIFAVDGSMGMGKTQLAKGVALGLGIEKIVSSPTFVLVKEYFAPAGIHFVHMDGWRLKEVKPEEIGLDQYIKSSTVIFIEWPEVLNSYLRGLKNAAVYAINITEQPDESRLIEMQVL